MAGGILKSFLISVAYEVDRSSEQRFAASVEKATLAVAAMGAALAAAATSVVVGVEKMSERFERLYYSSQRTGASITNMRAFAFAVGQLGGNAEAAQSSFENFARTLREAPSRFAQIDQLLKPLGKSTRDQNGNLRDTMEIYKDFGQSLARMPYYAGMQFFHNQFGGDEQTFRTLYFQFQELNKISDEYQRKQREAGLDEKGAGAHAAAFLNTQRSLWATVNAIYDTVFDHISTKLQGPMEKFDAWLESHSGRISGFFNKLSDTIATAFEKVWTVVQPELQRFADWISDPKTWKGFTDWVDKMSKPETWAGFLGAVKSVYGTIKAIVDSVAQLLAFARRLDEIVLGKATADKIWGPANADRPGATDSNGNLLPGSGGFGGSQLGGTGGLGTGLRGGGGGGGNGEQSESWWDWGKRKLGFGGSGSSGGVTVRDKTNYTGSNADVIRQAAKELGTSPHDLAMVMSYETGGTFSPHKWGGKGGNYMGLIQFGPSERAQFGANEKQTFAQQMPAVVSYLKTRGFKPGMGLIDLYSTINAGRPGRYNASDGNGTVASHVARMQREHERNVQAMLGAGSDQPSKVAVAARAIANSVVTPVEAAPLPKPWHMNAPTLDGSSPYGYLAPLGGDVSNRTNHVNVGDTHVKIDMSGVGGHNPMSTAKTIGDHLQNSRGLVIRQFSGAIE